MTADRRRTWTVMAAAGLLSMLLRVRMLWSAVSVDEGAYLAVARSWAHGHMLYRDIFIDRPQGLIVVFRVWDWASGGNTGSIRVLAMLFAAMLVVSVGLIVRETVGDASARVAVVLCAVLSAAPVLEGYAANAELLSGAVAAGGLALAVLAPSKQHRMMWFFFAGVAAGLALSLKQSGFDALLTVVVWLAIVGVRYAAQRRVAATALAAVTAGVMSVMVALATHGALTGWSRWWVAVAGYRLRTQSVFASADWGNLASTAPYAAVVLGLSALLAVVGARVAVLDVRRTRLASLSPRPVVLVIWLGWAFAGFVLGGGYYRHYWILLIGPLSALAALGVCQLERFRRVAILAALVPGLAMMAWVYVGDRSDLNVRAAGDHRAMLDVRVASWFNSHREHGETLYALCGSAAVYADAYQDPGYPFLWLRETRYGADAQNRLVAYLSDPATAPHFIAEYQTPAACDRSGRVGTIMHASYRKVAVIGSATMFERVMP